MGKQRDRDEFVAEDTDMAHAHTCLTCDAEIERGTFGCKTDADHDFRDCARCSAPSVSLLVWGEERGGTATRFWRLLDEVRGHNPAVSRRGGVVEHTVSAIEFAHSSGAPDDEWTTEWCAEIVCDAITADEIAAAADECRGVRAYKRLDSHQD